MYRQLIAKRNAEIVKMHTYMTVQEIAEVWGMKPREVRGAIRRAGKSN